MEPNPIHNFNNKNNAFNGIDLGATQTKNRLNSRPASINGKPVLPRRLSTPINASISEGLTNKTNQASLQIMENARAQPAKFPPLNATHEVVERPFKETVKKFLEEMRDTQKEKTTKYDGNQKLKETIKTRKIVCSILIGVAVTLLTAGIAAVCVFCPPVGALILGLGITAVACGAIGFGMKLLPASLLKGGMKPSEVQKITKEIESLNKALNIADNEGELFAKFLEDCPALEKEEMGGKVYSLEDLDHYVKLYENSKAQNAQKSELENLNNDIKNLTSEESREVENKQEKINAIQAKIQTINSNIEKLDVEKEESTFALKKALMKDIEETKAKSAHETNKSTGIENKEVYKGPDMRIGHPNLNHWLSKITESKMEKNLIIDNKKGSNLYAFGHSIPKTIKVPPKVLTKLSNSYELHQLNKKLTEKHNFTQNSFLSNTSLETDLAIDSVSYNSVTHYMIIKNIEKNTEKKIEGIKNKELSETETNKLIEEKNNQKNELIKAIQSKRTAKEAYDLAISPQVHRLKLLPNMGSGWNGLDFSDMDKELKTALYHKFIGPDGKPTSKGKQLLATEDKKIHICYELGDPSYELRFSPFKDEDEDIDIAPENNLAGENKLGVYLEEIRDILKNQQGHVRMGEEFPEKANSTQDKGKEELSPN